MDGLAIVWFYHLQSGHLFAEEHALGVDDRELTPASAVVSAIRLVLAILVLATIMSN